MTKLFGKGSLTLARVLALGAPVLLLGACAAPPPPCDACAVAARAEATANQALTIAQLRYHHTNMATKREPVNLYH